MTVTPKRKLLLEYFLREHSPQVALQLAGKYEHYLRYVDFDTVEEAGECVRLFDETVAKAHEALTGEKVS